LTSPVSPDTYRLHDRRHVEKGAQVNDEYVFDVYYDYG
jgi:hypothetical protein